MEGDWTMPPDPEWEKKDKDKLDKFHIYCVGRSVDEGRKAAMRWLIEFVGIAMDRKTKSPKRPTIFRKSEDIWIKRFGPGKLFNLKHCNARILADVWKGCTQASMHATTNTSHPRVDPPELAEALKIIIAHLEKHLYAPNGLILREVVRDKE